MARLRSKWRMIPQLAIRPGVDKTNKMDGYSVVVFLLRSFVPDTGYFLVGLWKKAVVNGIFRHAIR
ncbi:MULTISPECIES: hypothetical protein [Aeromonas]|uniref:hypothetical protein n=1 Tax=Aeromonas TaxID=642 RepID=UPI002B058DBD|nr:hypothetical protein [Aeromonas jandaei]